MTKPDTNGRIKLSWAQVAWAVGMMLMLGGAWADLRVQLEHVGTIVETNTARITSIEQRNIRRDAELMRDAIVGTARASERPKPRR